MDTHPMLTEAQQHKEVHCYKPYRYVGYLSLRINKLALAIHTGDRYVEETQSNMLCAGHFLRLAGCDKLFKYQLACHFYKTLYSEVRFD